MALGQIKIFIVIIKEWPVLECAFFKNNIALDGKTESENPVFFSLEGMSAQLDFLTKIFQL